MIRSKRHRAKRRLLGAVAAVVAMSPFSACAQASRLPKAVDPTPRLVVFVTIDAMRADYLERFEKQLTGGLAMLYHGGAVFTNGQQDHAITETAPGHAATMSGRFPVHTGIAANTAGVNDSTVFLIDANGVGASPFRFRGTTLTDWLAAKDPRTKVLSVSRKDRAAILPIGKSKRPIFWYAPNGIFTTSTYYSDTLPTWVQQFNERKIPASYAGRVWQTLLPASEYPEPDSVPSEDGGAQFLFPHVIPNDVGLAPQYLPAFPWMDEVTLQLALSGISELGLGAGPQTDLLAISLSTTDAVGHQYGPDSREMHDQIIRLDRSLGMFFDSLFKMRNKADIVIALTADHGLTPFPEVHAHDPNQNAKRINWPPVVNQFRDALHARGVAGDGLWFEDGAVTFDRPAIRRAGLNADSVVTEFRKAILRVPGILRADRIVDLEKQDTTRDDVARRWLHMFDESSGVDLVVTAEPYDYLRVNAQAQHGVPYESDTHVPIIFYGAAFRAGRYNEFTRVVDMAPTLAAVVHVTPLERLDGRALTQAIR
jgi:predicted AlkP superfamily pyrophosphatase or phosphodiesterase